VSQRFVTRAALSSFGLALGAALLTALTTGAFAALLLERAEDRRLEEAAVVLGAELKKSTDLAAAVEDEEQETTHMGVVFAVFDAATRSRLAGDARITWLPSGTCDALQADFRVCATSAGSYVVVAGAAYASPVPLLSVAALLASLFAGALAFVASRPLAAGVVAPLSELQQRLQSSGITGAQLGPDSGVLEVDALRAALGGLLRRIDEALAHATRFAADAAHELRTPLSTVLAELELLGDEPSAETVVRLRATVSRLSVLVERLLILATPGASGATELVSLRDVLEDTVQALPLAERSRVKLEVSGDVPLRGDATLLASMVSNALSNGLKFGNTVTARLTGEVLQFDDDGPGVPLDERAQVFEPLYRGRAARGAGVAGHGLGLALIAHVARYHHGTASFEDGAPGARLTLRFPGAAPR
jgi:two-component system, OmpR family, sensor kinase